jgi:hypothetical protein
VDYDSYEGSPVPGASRYPETVPTLQHHNFEHETLQPEGRQHHFHKVKRILRKKKQPKLAALTPQEKMIRLYSQDLPGISQAKVYNSLTNEFNKN